LHVDDATLESAHKSRIAAQAMLAGATDHMVHHLKVQLDMEVSIKKSVCVGSSVLLAVNAARARRTGVLTPVRSGKLLGVGAGGGRRRCVKFLAARIDVFNKGFPRIRKLRRSKINIVALVRAAGTPMITYGSESTGFFNEHLCRARRFVARAVSSEAGGNNFELVLYVADGARGSVDPAFGAHLLII